MENVRLVMHIRDNYPQVIKAYTNDEEALEGFDNLATELIKDFYLDDSERKAILDKASYECEADDGSVLVMEYIVVNQG